MFRLAADLVLLIHAAFALFVVLGGVAVWRHPRLAWLHVPAVLWGMLVELFGWICPLTPLEQGLRHAAGMATYSGDFLQHYLLAALYPEALTRPAQIALGAAVAIINLAVYARLVRRGRGIMERRHGKST